VTQVVKCLSSSSSIAEREREREREAKGKDVVEDALHLQSIPYLCPETILKVLTSTSVLIHPSRLAECL
jgi:hypothetical protein